MGEEIYLTEEGAEELRVELETLKGPKRLDLANRLKIAIENGDLSENADYLIAKEEQGFLEGRIQEIDYLLRHGQVFKENNNQDYVVRIGSLVTIQEEEDQPERWRLVGQKEADPMNGRISYRSPIGSAIFERKVGEEVIVKTPEGKIRIKILKIGE